MSEGGKQKPDFIGGEAGAGEPLAEQI
jgi:hypothetical protein